MRWLTIVVAVLVGLAVMANGQEAKPHSDAHKRSSAGKVADAPDTVDQKVIVVNQQAPQGQVNNHASKSPSYLHELLLPQNIPNIALVILAGITAFYVARQTRATAQATQAMR